MPSVNKVILIGNVGKQPEVRFTQSGDPIASFSLATSEKWKDKSGASQEKTEWHNVSVFGKTAAIVRDYVHKGSPVYIEGAVRYEEYTDKDGIKRKVTKIVLRGFDSKLVLLGSKGDADASQKPAATPHDASDSQATDDSDVPF